jgi:c-di-GMP-related signal transduction protein
MDLFLARQPIFDRQQNVIAYELLFRSASGGPVPDAEYEQAALNVIRDIFFVFGLEHLTTGKKAFINVSRRALVEEKITIFPPEQTVVEVVETIEPDTEVVAACGKLKQAGYKIALDDFIYHEKFDPLIELADYIKIDFKQTLGDERKQMLDRFAGKKVQLIAEKVETHREFNEAYAYGYPYFQGFFICVPEIIAGRDIPGFKVNYLRFLREVNQPTLNMDKLEQVIKQDVSLSYKLLRYLNSAWFGWRTEVTSIKGALVRLGEKPTKKWASMVAYTNLAEDKPSELLLTSLIRARFCELTGPEAGIKGKDLDLFLTGLFSLIDALVDRPLAEVLDEVSVSQEVKDTLLGKPSPIVKVFQLVVAYERGDWIRVLSLVSELSMDRTRILECYTQSVEWADRVFRM